MFDSLSAPLMKLVGLKAKEMAADDKYCSIIIDSEFFMVSDGQFCFLFFLPSEFYYFAF